VVAPVVQPVAVPPATTPVVPPVGTPTSPLQTLVDLVVEDPNLSTLETAVVTAGLVEVLSGPGPFTLFAPLDSAFAEVEPAVLAQLLTPEFNLHLQNFLAFHVTNGVATSGDLADGQVIEMLNEESITVSLDGTSVYLTIPLLDDTFVTAARVVEPDVEASNGIMHKIDDTPLLPAFLRRDLVDLLVSDPNHSTLVELVQLAGLEDALRSGTSTVFAPDNAAFDALPPGTVDSLLNDIPALANVLLHHVADGAAASNTLTSGLIPTLLEGESVEVSVLEEGIAVNGIPVVAPDGLARNGIAHGISGVLVPSGPVAPSTPEPGGAPPPAPVVPVPTRPPVDVPPPVRPAPDICCSPWSPETPGRRTLFVTGRTSSGPARTHVTRK